MMKRSIALGLGVLAGMLGAPVAAHAEPLVALKVSTSTSALVTFDSATPGTVDPDKPIAGLDTGDVLVSIDHRPDTGVLYGIAQSGKLYTLAIAGNAVTATRVGTNAVTLTGPSFGIDFNPSVDRIRVVSTARENLRLNPADATQLPAGASPELKLQYPVAGVCPTLDAPIEPIDGPLVIGVAYRNNVGGAAGFTDADGSNQGLLQYGIDARSSSLVRMGNANLNDGCVQTVGSLNITLDADPATHGGFDISTATGVAYASLSTGGGAPTLYTINLETGAATSVGALPADTRDVVALGAPKAAPVFAVTKSNKLLKFDASDPGVFTLQPTAITGLGAGEAVHAIDFRPKTGQLYALAVAGTVAKLYTVDKTTAAATVVNAAGFTVEGEAFGMDFNPVADALRITSNTGKNYRIAIADGDAGTDTDLEVQDGPDPGASPSGGAVAYTNNVAAPTGGTRLLLLDPAARSLFSQGSLADGGVVDGGPNGGQLFFVARAGVGSAATGDASIVGFDIAPDGTAYASFNAGGTPTSRFYQIDLGEQPAGNIAARFGRLIGPLPGLQGEDLVAGIAVEVPVPSDPGDAGTEPDSGSTSSSTSSSSSTGGTSSTSGGTTPPPDGGTSVPGATPGGEDDDGCNCRSAPTMASAPSALGLALATLWLVRRRRQSR
ncbi:MAG: DUF4394 domain-containing protein [Labilithrix sp.]|nr:DUF4394 domain-containing protein [Labilithrix sp.]MCW5815839.1 DUF4394 domain-containing protein [Labilithrix sp.]